MGSDTFECVWTGEFALNTRRVDEEIFESGKKKLRIQTNPDKCGRRLTESAQNLSDIGNVNFLILLGAGSWHTAVTPNLPRP